MSSGRPSIPAVRSRSNAPSAASSARCRSMAAARFGLPSSSSPSITNTTVAGIAPSSWRISRATNCAPRHPFEFALPLATTACPTPGSSRTSAANGGEVQSSSSAGCTSYIPYRSSLGDPGGPTTSPRTSGWPPVSTISARPPASSSQPTVAAATSRTPSPVALTDGVRRYWRIRSRSAGKRSSTLARTASRMGWPGEADWALRGAFFHRVGGRSMPERANRAATVRRAGQTPRNELGSVRGCGLTTRGQRAARCARPSRHRAGPLGRQ